MLHSTEEVRNRPTGQNGAPVMGPPATEQRLEENPPQNSHISSPEHSVLHFNPGSAIVPPFSNEQDLGHAPRPVRDRRSRLHDRLHRPNRTRPVYSFRHRIQPHVRPLDQIPAGYPRAAAYQSYDADYLIFRKFVYLRNRVILNTQDELAELEEELESLDNFDRDSAPERLYSRRRDVDLGPRRKELLQKIEDKLRVYDEQLLRLQRIQAIDPPTVRNQNSLYNLIRNSGSQTSTELEWIFNREDLAALATTQDNGKFNAFIQDSMFKISKPLTTWLFQTKEQRYMSGNEPSLIMLSPRRFNLFISIIITTLSSLLLLAPVALLYNFPDWGGWQILLIFAFTLIFATVCAAVTRAKRHEIFAATAAYCAVLVVFLANSAQFVVLPNGQPLSPATTHRLKLS